MQNLQQAQQAVGEAVGAGAQIVALPEMFNCPYRQDAFGAFAETVPEGETIRLLADLARQYHCYLIGGSIPERDGEHLYNTSLVFDRTGRIIARHRKIHLFDIDIPGQITFKESAVLTAGEALTCFDTEYGRFGVVICYDLRFPELFRLMGDDGAQAVFVPAAFNMTTGPAHWEILLRARAVDNQLPIIATSPARNPESGYQAYGHSLVVDSWGSILWEANDGYQVGVVDLDLQRTIEVRQTLPLLAHRRQDLYRVVQLGPGL